MHVGLLTTSYPTRPGDPSGAFVQGFAQALRGRGHRVDVLAPAPRHRPTVDARWVPYMPRWARHSFHGAGAPDNAKRPRAWPGFLTFPPTLTAMAARRPWDALISHFGIPCALVGGLVARGRPHLAVWHSADVHFAARVPGLAALARRSATRHWCVTEHARRALHLDDAIVSPMGADAPLFVRRDPTASGPLRVLFLGRLVDIKGLDVALRASRGLPVRWDIAGDGPASAGLQKLARELGIDATFHGALSGDAKARAFAEASLFAVPSRATSSGRVEGAPVALLEAQLAGLPVLASRSGGLPERVRDGVDGWLVPPGDEGEWRSALARAVRMRADLVGMGERGRVHNQRLTWERLAPVIESALAG